MKRWYALYTKPRKERQVSDILASKGIETYLPLVRVRKRGRRGEVEQPFFPCYLFARVDLALQGLSSVRWTPGLRKVVSFGGEPAAIPDAMVALIRKRLAERDYPQYEAFKPGERVRIKAGPLQDLEGIFDRNLSPSDRVRVLVDILGRLTPCEIEVDYLEKYPPRAEAQG
ncbi:MAG TPA: hypothetical protein EYP55_02520 [Anaerolineae bacterium]|nr:hypothetical protein [Anaerolineae bacterium]